MAFADLDNPRMLPLDDCRWTQLYAGGDDAAYVPTWLCRLTDRPDDLVPFEQERWMLCSDEVTWSASYAAAPFLLEAARRAQPVARFEYICFLGSVAMYRVPHDEADQCTACPRDLEPAFLEALAGAEEIAIAMLPEAKSEADVRRLLAALAAFKGFSGLARGILDLQHEARRDLPPEEIAF